MLLLWRLLLADEKVPEADLRFHHQIVSSISDLPSPNRLKPFARLLVDFVRVSCFVGAGS